MVTAPVGTFIQPALPFGGPDVELYEELVWVADAEGLLYYGRRSFQVPTELVALTRAGLIRPYSGGRGQQSHVWVPSIRAAPSTQPQSDLPAPSLQNGSVLQAYIRRDDRTCHLCDWTVVFDGRRREACPSLDHLIPRSLGGSDYPSNIAISHQSCNKARRDRPIEVARARERLRQPWWRR